jgi:ABC-2 type transport system permease protein
LFNLAATPSRGGDGMTSAIAGDGTEMPVLGYRPARFSDVVRCEWTKAWSVRSTTWTLLTAAVLAVGIGALISAVAGSHYKTSSLSDQQSWDPTSVSNSGLSIAQLAIGVLGVLLITSEYSTGTIRTSLAAVPRRNRLFAAKGLIVVSIVVVAVEIITFAAFFIGQALMSDNAPTATIGQTNVLRALIGCGLYGAVLGLLGLALGAVLRNAAASIAVLVALLFVLPGVAAALPGSIEHTVEKFWPTQAGQQVGGVSRGAHTLSPWAGFAVFCLFVAIVSAIAVFTLNCRDA